MDHKGEDVVMTVDWFYRLKELIEHGLSDLHVLESSIVSQAAKIRQKRMKGGRYYG